MDRKAQKSIAMLIVQVASIMLAVIIIGYIVDYINTTAQSGMDIPRSTAEMAKTGIVIKDVTGFTVDSNSSDMEGLILTVSPSAGSDPIDLGKSIVYIRIGNKTARLRIINGSTTNNRNGGFSTG